MNSHPQQEALKGKDVCSGQQGNRGVSKCLRLGIFFARIEFVIHDLLAYDA
jgi:hypothetical protein